MQLGANDAVRVDPMGSFIWVYSNSDTRPNASSSSHSTQFSIMWNPILPMSLALEYFFAYACIVYF